MSRNQVATIAVKVLLFGILTLLVGLWTYSCSDSNPYDVSCGGQQMKSGDTCSIYSRRGGSHTETYSERVANNIASNEWERTYGPVIAGFGGLLVVGGLLALCFHKEPASSEESPEAQDTVTDPEWWHRRDQS